jgi:hypothetical protein
MPANRGKEQTDFTPAQAGGPRVKGRTTLDARTMKRGSIGRRENGARPVSRVPDYFFIM